MARRKETASQTPRFRSAQEEAAFWDTHTPLDYPGEWVEDKGQVERPLTHILGVRLDAQTIDKLAAIGRKKRIGPSTLARMWLMERLSEPEEQAQEQPTCPVPTP